MALSMHRVASRPSGLAPSRVAGVARAPRVVVFAQEPRFTLDNSRNSAEGFVEKDTAGQSNMYPSVIKPFEAGSSADTVKQDEFNNGIAVGGAGLALGAIGLGLTALIGTGGSAPEAAVDVASYQPLSVYAAKFAEELAPPKPKPVAVAVPAPEVVAEAPAVASE
ncbi:hypothetical protein GPECTOR_22g848 [Gonium pectorale]|uniref:Uncharacterized protein n=1 Tax=Gonium pectorale TaxID=33097 RepID=A0A150GI01_GONPE|nr:hypothetical protein GPECTOR_22g848 [Gonium pectorale]|eukprot:KXZ49255.1 hypothetical protein GPECTOR_22g848 [Gonium pectorale]